MHRFVTNKLVSVETISDLDILYHFLAFFCRNWWRWAYTSNLKDNISAIMISSIWRIKIFSKTYGCVSYGSTSNWLTCNKCDCVQMSFVHFIFFVSAIPRSLFSLNARVCVYYELKVVCGVSFKWYQNVGVTSVRSKLTLTKDYDNSPISSR